MNVVVESLWIAGPAVILPGLLIFVAHYLCGYVALERESWYDLQRAVDVSAVASMDEGAALFAWRFCSAAA